jgi:hypothetical protein
MHTTLSVRHPAMAFGERSTRTVHIVPVAALLLIAL